MQNANIKKTMLMVGLAIMASPSVASAVVFSNPLGSGVSTIGDLLQKIVNFLFFITGPIAVIMILYAAFLLVTSAGESKKIDQAKEIIKYVVVGVIVLILSGSLMTFIGSFF